MSKSLLASRPALLRPLPRAFFARDPRRVAKDILGKVLVRKSKRDPRLEEMSGRIVEVEAYLGETDPAAHAAAGKTLRNSVLFGPPGHAYVYFIYGNHYCLNVSCEPEGQAGCILFRALEPLSGVKKMARNRGIEPGDFEISDKNLRNLTSGPGRLCQAFSITRERDNGTDLTLTSSNLLIYDDGFHPSGIRMSPRIGITKASDLPLRYFLAGNSFVSGPKLKA